MLAKSIIIYYLGNIFQFQWFAEPSSLLKIHSSRLLNYAFGLSSTLPIRVSFQVFCES
jgi:hypothetical protein